MRRALLTLLFLLLLPLPALAACTGGSPTWTATDSSGLTTCIGNAVPGDTIIVNAGTTYTGNYTFPDKGAGTSYITIQSSDIASLPAGRRVSPSDATYMAKIRTSTTLALLQFNVDSHHWKFLGIEFTTDPALGAGGQYVPLMIVTDGSGAVTFNHWPHHITFDRCYCHPAETDPLAWRSAEECFAIDGADITYTNNYIDDFMGFGPPVNTDVNGQPCGGVGCITITSATNANPVVVTLNAGYADPGGAHAVLLTFAGGTTPWDALNGTKVATWIDNPTGSSTRYSLQNYDLTALTRSNIDSTGFGAFGAQAINQQTQSISTSRCFLMIAGPGPYLLDNNYCAAYYSPIFTGGGGTWLDPNHTAIVQASPSPTLTTVRLDNITDLQVGDYVSFGPTVGTPNTIATQNITAVASSGAGCSGAGALTCLTVTPHGFPAGTLLYGDGGLVISGFTGNWDAGLNTPGCTTGALGHCARQATVVDSTHLTVPVDSSGFGTPAGQSGTFYVYTFEQFLYHIGRVTAINAGTKDVTFEWRGHQPTNTGGTGAGFLIAAGAEARWRGLVVHDITVTHNTIGVKKSWIWLIFEKGGTCVTDTCSQPSKAMLWEAKDGDNILVQGNYIGVLGGTPSCGGLGSSYVHVAAAVNQATQSGGDPWNTTNNWTFRSNIFCGAPYQKLSQIEEQNVTGAVSSGMVWDNNLFTAGANIAIELEGTSGTSFTHNTFRNVGGGNFFYVFNDNPSSIIRDNIGNFQTYGFNLTGGSTWGFTADHNFLIDSAASGPSSNCGTYGNTLGSAFYPTVTGTCVTGGADGAANTAAMLFVDVASADAGGDYHGYKLQAGSPGHNAASDGKDVGVDFAALDAALGLTPTTLTGPLTIKGPVRGP